MTHEQLREFAAVQDEKHREHDANVSRLQGAMDAMAAKGKTRKCELQVLCPPTAVVGTAQG